MRAEKKERRGGLPSRGTRTKKRAAACEREMRKEGVDAEEKKKKRKKENERKRRFQAEGEGPWKALKRVLEVREGAHEVTDTLSPNTALFPDLEMKYSVGTQSRCLPLRRLSIPTFNLSRSPNSNLLCRYN